MNFNKGQGLQITVAGLLPVTEKPLLETEWSSIVFVRCEKKLKLLYYATRGHSDGDQKILLFRGHYLRMIAFVIGLL